MAAGHKRAVDRRTREKSWVNVMSGTMNGHSRVGGQGLCASEAILKEYSRFRMSNIASRSSEFLRRASGLVYSGDATDRPYSIH